MIRKTMERGREKKNMEKKKKHEDENKTIH